MQNATFLCTAPSPAQWEMPQPNSVFSVTSTVPEDAVCCGMALEAGDVCFLLSMSTTCPFSVARGLNPSARSYIGSQMQVLSGELGLTVQSQAATEPGALEHPAPCPASCRAIMGVRVRHSERKSI